MFDVSTSIEVNAPVAVAFAVLWDVERYPEFLTDVVDVYIQDEPSPEERVVYYAIRAPRMLNYSLNMRATGNTAIGWNLVDSDLQQANRGSWEIQAQGDVTLLTVHVQMDFRVPVSDVILKKLVEFNLPVMLRQIRARVEQTWRETQAPRRAV